MASRGVKVPVDSSEDAAALWEIDENFARSELTDAQRADHHVRREAILVRMGEVAAGGKGGDRRSTDKLSVGYATRAAADLGVDERTVRRDLRRGKNIDADVLAEVAGLVGGGPLTDHGFNRSNQPLQFI